MISWNSRRITHCWQFDTPADALPKIKLSDGYETEVMAGVLRAFYKPLARAARA